MLERFNRRAWKARVPIILEPGVRIPLSPPKYGFKINISVNSFFGCLLTNNSQLLKEYDNLLKNDLNLTGNVK